MKNLIEKLTSLIEQKSEAELAASIQGDKKEQNDTRSPEILKEQFKNVQKLLTDKNLLIKKLESQNEGITKKLDEITGQYQEIKKERNFWRKQCKETCERLDSQQSKNDNYKKQSEDLLNKNKKLRIRFENYEKEIEKLKTKIARLEDEAQKD